MKVVLSTFTCAGIKALLGGDIAAGVGAALRHYAERAGGSEPSWLTRRAIPYWTEHRPARIGAEVELALDPMVKDALEREALEMDGISTDQVVNHAVLAYLADLDRALELGAPTPVPG